MRKSAGEEDSFGLGRQSASAEALGLYRMVGHDGNTVEALRVLIAVPPKIERALQAFAKANPHEAHWIESSLKFRQVVLEEFERLVGASVSVADLPEEEELELDPSDETYAIAQA